MIYEVVPEDKILPETTDWERMRVYELLLKNSHRYLTANNIALLTGIDNKDDATSARIRKIITELVEVDHVPVISGKKGFKLATSDDELERYVINLRKRINGIRRRLRSVELIKRLDRISLFKTL